MGMFFVPYVIPVMLKVPKVAKVRKEENPQKRTAKKKTRMSKTTERRIVNKTESRIVNQTERRRRGTDLRWRPGKDEVNAHSNISNNYKEPRRLACRNRVGERWVVLVLQLRYGTVQRSMLCR
jgi:hypothetical protein